MPEPWSGRAPGRVNLIGEHVDYLGGPVLPAAIDRFTRVRGASAGEWEVRSEVAGGLAYVRAVGELLGFGPQRVEIESDVPSGAGVSSSAALLVAVAAGLRPGLDGVEAARLCQQAERAATGVQVGIMDQFAAALGRAGQAILLDCDSLRYEYVPFPAGAAIAVIESGITRNLADTPYNQRRREAEAGLPKRRRHVESEIDRVGRFAAAMRAADVEQMGRLLRTSHESLRDDFEVSTPAVDAIVERAWASPGCLGARIMGAGFGGAILALVRTGSEREFAAAVEHPVLFCATADGAFIAANS
ncbi:MAG TPA: galactokinase family protein [Candidatus Dormibacteraeota bacterium]